MTNVHTLNDINKGDGSFKEVGQRLGSAYEQELKEKLYSALKSKAEINDLSEKLVDKYNEQEKEFENKASQLIASTIKVRFQLISERKSHSESQRELEARYTAKIKSLKFNIKTLKREATLAQKASSADKIKILSLKTKVRELEEDLVQSDPKEIDSLRLELERVKENLNSKEYTIECMEKGIEATHETTKLEKNNKVDSQPPPMNNLSQLGSEGTPSTLNPSQIISIGGAEAVPLLATAPIVTSSSILLMLIYSILTLVLITIICLMARKWWNSWKKDD
ncbi:hypothetical protein RclHR1_16870006 [Rhizophagus clarus]|uniref:Uncharacterized protein n=1 Tax=Rhizophagus clarus TaxID=94130 RepID=A0A2Z6QIR6_9GLOM|nr:hypothetical protein RclHR1_16870006 [Rhizophagus clarus]